MSSLAVIDENTWVSGSRDKTCRVWDRRAPGTKCALTLPGHEATVNCVKIFPNKQAFGSCSEDSTARLFDIRGVRQLNIYADEDADTAVSCCGFNASGSIIYTGMSEGSIIAWYTLSGEFFDELHFHNSLVESIELSPDGKAMCTAAREPTAIVWA